MTLFAHTAEDVNDKCDMVEAETALASNLKAQIRDRFNGAALTRARNDRFEPESAESGPYLAYCIKRTARRAVPT